ncbi:DUF3644 domain-containing protein [Cellulosimicrobium funkei]|uniref:DUF3644 domain-containing protein n=1 Tax=Cellulosimicrobium funkei TaxID=264251 RepID=UPI0030F61E8E
MPPRPRWWHQLQASKKEALLAIDLYNRSGHERQLEAFVVHMSLAWLRLMQAKVDHDDGDLYIRNKRRQRIRHEDGGWKMKPLSDLTAELLPTTDARRANLEFFTGLRNIIEHRFERDVASLVAGRTQAHVLNYEATLVDWFGVGEGLGDELRFPIFISTFTGDAVASVKEVRKRVPKGVLDWVQDLDANMDPAVANAPQFDFRVYLIPHTGPKTQADAAMTFVRMEELDDKQRAAMEHVQTIIREKHVPVANLGRLKPGEVAAKVAADLGQRFTIADHTNAWRHYDARPGQNATRPEATKSQFCVWDGTFRQYVYTEAWVSYLVRHLSNAATYELVCGRPPVASAASQHQPGADESTPESP